MSDEVLLGLAARTAGLSLDRDDNGNPVRVEWFRGHLRNEYEWNPFTDDGDALRLAVKLRMMIEVSDDGHEVRVDLHSGHHWTELCNTDPYAATRLAIVSAAAQIGKGM